MSLNVVALTLPGREPLWPVSVPGQAGLPPPSPLGGWPLGHGSVEALQPHPGMWTVGRVAGAGLLSLSEPDVQASGMACSCAVSGEFFIILESSGQFTLF